MENDRNNDPLASWPLASWNDGPAKQSILDFVKSVTHPESVDFVPVDARVAVFDNDGTLWCEKPLPIQADFLLRRIGAMAQQDPGLKSRQPWKAVVEKDHRWLSEVITKHYHGDDRDLIVMTGGLLQAYEDLTIEQFESTAYDFLRTAEHPTLHLPYLECTYQPMVELLVHLERNGFSNYIASGGSRDFMRPVTQDLYGVAPDHVIGSSVALEYQDGADFAEIIHKPKVDLFDDGPAKPVRIWSRIGRRPILAAGNSNGDIPMLRFCKHPSRLSLSVLVNHDDPEREFDYRSGAEDALKRAEHEGWVVASIRRDWNKVFVRRPDRRT